MEEGKASGLSVEKMCEVAVVSPVPGFLPVVSAVVLLTVALSASMLPGALAACVNVMKALRSD